MAGEYAAPTHHGPEPLAAPHASALSDRIDGEVRADDYTRHLYATDASLYRCVPEVVIFPKHRRDVVETVQYCTANEVPILPRGGGTSLAGQTINEAVVLDFTRYMDDIIEVDQHAQRAIVQPGLVVGDLNLHLERFELHYGAVPASGHRATVGGGIGNDTAGAHSLVYGSADDNLQSIELVLADGSVHTFGPTDPAEIEARARDDGLLGNIYSVIHRLHTEEAETIEKAYPPLHRNVAGYNLDSLLEPDPDGRLNLARFIAGSEGTLGIITEATIELAPSPEAVGTMLLSYADFIEAMADVGALLEHDPAAVESMDAPLLDKARAQPKFADKAAIVPASADGVLLVEIFGPDASSVNADLETLTETFGPENGRTIDVIATTDVAERERFWALRKSALPLMLSETTDEKHVAFVEDAVVPPKQLPGFVEGFLELLDVHDTYASFYGHAGPGVLHVRPMVDVASIDGRKEMRSIAEGAFELTMAHEGSICGEHGDGRVRTEWTKRQYGTEIVGLFEAIKDAFDPDGLLNPGPITGDVTIEEDQRIEPGHTVNLPFEPALAWENDNGLRGMVELCHGCGGCRTSQAVEGGIMCPTFRATNEEIASTRGRANLLREAIRGNLPPETLFDPRFESEVLDLCIGCKGCLHDCPSGVDLATLKAELQYQRIQRAGTTHRERVLASFPTLAKWGSLTAPISNWVAAIPGANRIMARTFGLSPHRRPITFAPTAFTEWADGRVPAVTESTADRRVVVVPDPYTNYLEPSVGQATVHLLEAAGVAVKVDDELPPPGRAAYSQGFIDEAREYAKTTVDRLEPMIEEGWDVVVPEPSAAAMYQSDYAHLLGTEKASTLAAAAYTPLAYLAAIEVTLDVEPPMESHLVHDHCHQQSLGRGELATSVLADHGFEVETVDSGCCGMAGSFGYEREHYDLSVDIGNILTEQIEAADPSVILATGTSCRSQLEHLDPGQPIVHPSVVLADALSE